MAGAWGGLGADAQRAAIAYAHARGALVIVSAGGATDMPYNSMSGAAYGAGVARWAVAHHMDGVDFDMESFEQGLRAQPMSADATINWLVDASRAARAILCPARLIFHAPQAPYFGAVGSDAPNPWTLTTGGYTAVWARAGPAVIDGFLVQFYNQGTGCYTSYTSLVTQANVNGSCPFFPGTSLAEIDAVGVPLNRLVVGKYMLPVDAGTGLVLAPVLGSWLARAAAELGWAPGVMVWTWSLAAGPAWIAAVFP